MMKNVLKLTTGGDRDVVMTRTFDAPRTLVFEAWTKPELVKRWLGVHDGWSLAVCEIDLRVGGRYRYEWKGTGGKAMAMGGVFREVVVPERLVATEKFDEAWYPGEAVGTTVFTERDGKTTLMQTVTYQSREARDAVLATPMEKGIALAYDKLDEVLLSQHAPH